MKDIDVVITPRDPLLFRDGRPFGQPGVAQTGGLKWPRPSTLAGMVRTFVGFSSDEDYFADGPQRGDHIKAIRQVGLGLFLPALGTGEGLGLCLPVPADAVAFSPSNMRHVADKPLNIKALIPKELDAGEGTDISWPNWLYPWMDEQEKPQQMPLWHWEHYEKWLVSNSLDLPDGCILSSDLGLGEQETEERTHVCIDGASGTAAESLIFVTRGCGFSPETRIVAQVQTDNEYTPAELDMASLGGDRRLVQVNWGQNLVPWPQLPKEVGKNVRGLRLILATPGMFEGGWAPSWLLASLENNSWERVPNTEIRLRLCSACVPRFVPSHGWDMARDKFGAPKPMRKAVPAGAVYFVEAHEETDLKKVAETLWNTSLCEDRQDALDGFGRILVGNWR